MITVLVTPAGSGMAATCLKALNEVDEIRTITTDIDNLASGLYLADAGYIVPDFEGPYLDAIAAIVEREDVDVVIPALDDVLDLFARRRARIIEAGAEVMISSPEAIAVTQDKWQTYERLKPTDVPVPDSWIEWGEIPRQIPKFIKPRRGSGSENAFRVASKDALEFYFDEIDDPIVQEYLPGREVTVDCLATTSRETVTVPRERLETKGGISVKNVVIESESLETIGHRISDLLDLKGAFFFQAKENPDGKFKVTEINARIAGSMCAGFVTPSIQELAVRDALGEAISEPVVHYGKQFTRYWAERYISDGAEPFETIEGSG